MGKGALRAVVAGAVVAALVVLVADPVGAVDRAKVRKPGPRRVLLMGDSITYNYEFAAEQLLAAKGYQVIKMGIASTSLLDEGICNGLFARQLMFYVDPDVVVMEYNGNYKARAGVAACRPEKPYGSDAWLRRWTTAAKVNRRQLIRRGARFLFIEAPSVKFSPKREVVPQINARYRGVGATIDAWTAFGGATFDQSLRYDDQHLNAAGAQRMANLVAAAVG
jgi:hypothetical protein